MQVLRRVSVGSDSNYEQQCGYEVLHQSANNELPVRNYCRQHGDGGGGRIKDTLLARNNPLVEHRWRRYGVQTKEILQSG